MNAARINVAPWSLKATAGAVARGWDAFFHVPCDARVCAAIRIAYATIVLIHLAVLYPDLDLWFTDAGVLTREAALKIASPYSSPHDINFLGVTVRIYPPGSLFALLPGTAETVHACFWIAVAHAVCLLIGLLPRLNALLLFVWLISFQVRNDPILDGEDCLMRVMGFFVIWLPSGQCWSVNAAVRRWWGKRDACSTEAPGWPLRLLQLEMAAMFFSSALMKLAGEPWLDGTALYYVSRLDDFFGRLPVPAWAFDTPWVVAVMTWSVVAAEFCIPFLIWFRETRRPCLLVLLAFHLANEWTMNLFLFHWIMLCGWIAFVTPEDFAWILAGWKSGAATTTTDEGISRSSEQRAAMTASTEAAGH